MFPNCLIPRLASPPYPYVHSMVLAFCKRCQYYITHVYKLNMCLCKMEFKCQFSVGFFPTKSLYFFSLSPIITWLASSHEVLVFRKEVQITSSSVHSITHRHHRCIAHVAWIYWAISVKENLLMWACCPGMVAEVL